jgi:TRAP transporter TAXI family solute receptor
MRRLFVFTIILFSQNLFAQVVGLGTTQVGATNQLSTAIAKIVSDKGLQLRTQPMAGAAQYAALVNNGDIELGISNAAELHYLVKGEVIVEKPNPNLRAVARLVPWYNGLVVKKDSPIRTLKDLKGQPMPSGFAGNPLGRVLVQGYLANAGLTFEDTRQVPVPAFPRMFDAFKQQQTATSIAVIGMSQLQEWTVALGGVRFLPFDDSPAAVAAMGKYIPNSYVAEVKPGAGKVGIDVPTKMLVYDYVLWSNDKVKDDMVTKVIDALYTGVAELKATGPLWQEFDNALMARDSVGLGYHPAAAKYYQSKGLKSK